MRRAAAVVLVVLVACKGSEPSAPAPSPTPQTQTPSTSTSTTTSTTTTTTPDAAGPEVLAGADFTAEARLLFRIAACGGEDALPEGVDAKLVGQHCKRLLAQMTAYRDKYFVGARAFFDELVPDDAPKVVVYPFGGGDLISALVAFPDATEITTISLELSGDPRRITTLDRDRLERSLAALRVEIGGTLQVGSNTSENLSASQNNDLPAQVSSFLMGLAAGGYQPIGMRYFRLEDDGAIHYLEADEIAAMERAKKRKSGWVSPNFSEAFAHVEIRYRKGDDPTVRVHRHLGWNLGDAALAEQPQLLRHLEAKGKVTILTKGASYLLWMNSFATIRDHLLAHLAWMLSDSTGVPPQYAKAAGMVQEPWGRFSDAFLPHARGTRHARAFRKLWKDSPKRKLPFRFGYLDASKSAHLVVTRPAD